MNFNEALVVILHHEGGYANNPNDPGRETNFGVTIRVAREFGYTGPMRDIPMDVVRTIYKKLYWDKINGDNLPPAIALATFDFAVNSGPSRAARYLQRAARVPRDGIIGPQTIGAVTAAHDRVLVKLLISRIKFMIGLNAWKFFGKGWAHRMIELTFTCARIQ